MIWLRRWERGEERRCERGDVDLGGGVGLALTSLPSGASFFVSLLLLPACVWRVWERSERLCGLVVACAFWRLKFYIFQ